MSSSRLNRAELGAAPPAAATSTLQTRIKALIATTAAAPRRPCVFEIGDEVCGISTCVQRVRGLKANSASPTDTWIVYWGAGTTLDGDAAPNAFMKIYLSPNQASTTTRTITPKIQGLEYESLFYQHITSPLYERGYCKSFVRYFFSGRNCTYDDMMELLTRGTSPAEARALRSNFLRSVYSMCGNARERPSVTDRAPATETARAECFTAHLGGRINLEGIASRSTYNYIVTEAMPDDAITFHEWLSDVRRRRAIRSADNAETLELLTIVFQIFVAIYALGLTKSNHNDLHSGNIWLIPLAAPRRMSCLVNGTLFVFMSSHVVKLYDYDRSFNLAMGENRILNRNTCRTQGLCSAALPKVDFMKITSYLFNCGGAFDDRAQPLFDLFAFIMHMSVNDPTYDDFTKRVFENGCNLIDPDVRAFFLEDPNSEDSMAILEPNMIVYVLGSIICDLYRDGDLDLERFANVDVDDFDPLTGEPSPVPSQRIDKPVVVGGRYELNADDFGDFEGLNPDTFDFYNRLRDRIIGGGV